MPEGRTKITLNRDVQWLLAENGDLTTGRGCATEKPYSTNRAGTARLGLQLENHRGRLKRWALWIPSIVALVVYLFFPEIYGLASHLSHNARVPDARYQFRVPMTWIIMYNEGRGQGGSFTLAYIGRGVGQGGNPFSVPMSEVMLVSYPPTNDTGGQSAGAVDRDLYPSRVLPIGKTMLTCWEVPPGRYFVITCFTPSGDFHAKFTGQKADMRQFYQVLESVTQRE